MEKRQVFVDARACRFKVQPTAAVFLFLYCRLL